MVVGNYKRVDLVGRLCEGMVGLCGTRVVVTESEEVGDADEIEVFWEFFGKGRCS